jgi:hypothetical protein
MVLRFRFAFAWVVERHHDRSWSAWLKDRAKKNKSWMGGCSVGRTSGHLGPPFTPVFLPSIATYSYVIIRLIRNQPMARRFFAVPLSTLSYGPS